MKAGDYIRTPRFCTVKIEKVFDGKTEARAEGYTEPTHYEGEDEYEPDDPHYNGSFTII